MLISHTPVNSRRIFAVILIFAAIIPAFLRAEDASVYQGRRISEVATAGNVYITSAKILSFVRSRPGQQFDLAQVNEDVSRVAKIKGVEIAYFSAEPAGEEVRLIYVISEKSVIREITFSGDKKYSAKKLTSELGFSRGDYLDKFTAKSGAENLQTFYKKRGYPFVSVEYDDSGIAGGRLHYTITRGQRVKIKKYSFKGNEHIKAKELKSAIKSKPRNFLIFQNYFKQDVLDEDVIRLQKAYDSRGYLDTKVDTEIVYKKNKKYAELIYKITEGRQYDVETIEISGNTFLSDANLASSFKLKQEEFFSNQRAEHDRDEILKAYHSAGFVDVDVKMQRQFTADNKIVVNYDIAEGQRFKIGNINISGNRTVQDKVIRRVLDEDDFKPGQWYNSDMARGDGQGELEKNMKSAAYTETATITAVDSEISDSKDAEVRIKEGKTGSVMFGAGVSSSDGIIGQMIYEQRNFDYKKWPKSWRKFFSDDSFKGAGQRLKIALEPGTEVSRYSISFTEPYLKDKPVSMTLSGSSWARERESYDEERQKGYIGFTKRMKEGRYRVLAFRFENVSVDSLESGAPKEARDVKGDNFLAGIKVGFGRDMTNNRYTPTDGKSYEFTYEQVTLDHTFGVVEGTYRWYKTLKEDFAERKTVLETKLYGGYIVGDAPLFEKFYAGGSGSLRGFEYRGVSPRSGADSDPVGSDWIITASSEVVIPMVGETLSGLFFVDTGMIESGGIRASAGIGVQIMIPQWFGPVPMRFELGYPFMKDGDDDTEYFSFSVGSLF